MISLVFPILATTGLSLVLYVTGFFVIFTPLPYLLTFFKKGWWVSLAATVLSLVLLVFLYRKPAEPFTFLPMMAFYPALPLKVVMGLSILYLSYYLWISWVVALGSGALKGFNREVGFAGMMLAILIPTVAGYFLLSVLTGTHLSHDLGEAFQVILQKVVDLQTSSQSGGGMSAEELAYLKEYTPDLVQGFLGIFPSLWVVFTMLVLSVNLLFVRRWLVESRPFPKWDEFNLWRLGERWIWAPIAGGGLYFFNIYVVRKDFLEIGLINGLIVLGAVYFCQGLAIVSYFFRKKLSTWTRLAAYMAIFLFIQVVGVLILAIGLFDFWFDFRKLKKVA